MRSSNKISAVRHFLRVSDLRRVGKKCLRTLHPLIFTQTHCSRSIHTMAHSLSTQTLGNFDLPPYISSQSFGNVSHVAIPHEWMMMNGKYTENMNYYTTNSFVRDGLGHGDENWSGKDCGRKNGDWDGGFFLEHCHAKDCFFGCEGSHSTYVRHDESYGRNWFYDDGQDEFGSVKRANVLKRQSFLDSNRSAKSSPRYYHTSLCVNVVLILLLNQLVLDTMDVTLPSLLLQLNQSPLVIADFPNHSRPPPRINSFSSMLRFRAQRLSHCIMIIVLCILKILNQFSSKQNCAGVGQKKDPADTGCPIVPIASDV